MLLPLLASLVFVSSSVTVTVDGVPLTRVDTVIDTIHGVEIPDPYRWLEDQSSPETRAWIEAQNAYARTSLDSLPVAAQIAERLTELRAIDRVGSTPWERDGRFLLWKKRASDDLWMLYLRTGVDGSDEVLLDPHTMSADHTVSVDRMDWSADGRYLVYSVREGGPDEVEVRVLDVETGDTLPDRLPRAIYTGVSFVDGAGGPALVYGRHDREAGTSVRIHRLGTDLADDVELFSGRPPDQWVSPDVAADDRTVLIVVYHGWSRSELHLVDLEGDRSVRTLVDDVDANFLPQFAGDKLVVQTEWKAPNRRVLVADLADPAFDRWREVVPEGPDAIEGVSAAAGRLYVHRLRNVSSVIDAYDLDGTHLGMVELPGIGSASTPSGAWDGTSVFYSFNSLVRPRIVNRIDAATGDATEWTRDDIAFDADAYELRQEWFTSRDGTRVPMFIVHRKGLKRGGMHPTLLGGYGGFNVSVKPGFSTHVAIWLENGGVYASANIRGGGEFGDAWHRAGMLEKKQNVFDDFIAAAQHLIRSDYTNPDRLAIRGGSNGGLLVAACLTQRPDLYRAVLCEYPDLDMVRYYQFENHNAPALLEYGDASDPEQFEFLRKYSPYQAVRDGIEYPAVLLTTGDNDTRVPPLQARKMTARLQAASTSGRPVMLLYDTAAGHAGGKPFHKQIADESLTLAFLFWQLEVTAN